MSFRHILLSMFISGLWGINFAASKVAVSYFPPFFMLALRLLIVGAVLLPFVPRPTVPMEKIVKIALCLGVLHFGMMFSGLHMGVDIGIATIIDQLRVPFAALLGVLFFREKLGWKGVLGIGVALLGSLIVFGLPRVIGNPIGALLVFGSTVAWAFYNIQIKHLGRMNIFSFICFISLFSVPPLLLLSFLFEEQQLYLLYHVPNHVMLSLLYIAFVATIIAHGIWYHLLCLYPVNLVVPYSLLVPVFGLMAGHFLLNEPVSWQLVLGGTLTVLGVLVIVIKKPRSAKGGLAT